MGFIKPVEEVKLFIALLSRDERLFEILKEKLSLSFGPVDYISPVYPWTHTKYYEKEMGSDLKRMFLFFEKPVLPECLSDIKNRTNEIERQFVDYTSQEMPVRPVNIDPGYLTLSKVVLASTKDYSHRIYIGKGIYAEVTLYHKDGSFQPFPYTYPDYRSMECIDMFNRVREGGRGKR